MHKGKQRRLESKGWKVGTVDEFLDLAPEESAYIELKLKLSENVRKLRKSKRLTQIEFARRVKSSQSRVAKIEAGDPSVSVDLLIRSLLALGATHHELARIISAPRRSTAA